MSYWEFHSSFDKKEGLVYTYSSVNYPYNKYNLKINLHLDLIPSTVYRSSLSNLSPLLSAGGAEVAGPLSLTDVCDFLLPLDVAEVRDPPLDAATELVTLAGFEVFVLLFPPPLFAVARLEARDRFPLTTLASVVERSKSLACLTYKMLRWNVCSNDRNTYQPPTKISTSWKIIFISFFLPRFI